MQGLYKIKNKTTNFCYIGSSFNVNKRLKDHFRDLKYNKHKNKFLQEAYNIYGIDDFNYEIVSIFENISREELLNKEKLLIDSYDFNKLYNINSYTTGGYHSSKLNEYFIIDLQGRIIKFCNSLLDISLFFNYKTTYPSHLINTSSITNCKYRVVSVEFYEKEMELILSWRKYSNNKRKYEEFYYYDNIKNKWIVEYNKEIIATINSEKQAIKISKWLIKENIENER